MPELKIVPSLNLKLVKDLPGGTIFKVPSTGGIYVKVANPRNYKFISTSGACAVTPNIINPVNGMIFDYLYEDVEVEIIGQLKLG